MKCKSCKTNIATQTELLSVACIPNQETGIDELNIVFIEVCKTCSLEVIKYDQETIDDWVQIAQENIAKGLKVIVYGRNEKLFDLL